MQNTPLFIPTLITIVSILSLTAAIAVIHRQQEQLDEERWTRHKIFPLIAEVDHLDEDQREYLTPEVVAGLKSGQMSVKAALSTQHLTIMSSKRS